MVEIARSVINDYIESWLGYGDPSATTWFVGIEESFGRWANQNTRGDLLRFLEERRDFDVAEDLVDAFEDTHGVNFRDWTGPSTWKYQAAFLMELDDDYKRIGKMDDPGREAFQYVFQDQKLGRRNGENFTAELLPLPQPTNEIEPPHTDVWTSYEDYVHEVLPARINLLGDVLRKHEGVERVIVYGKTNQACLGLRILFRSTALGQVAIEGDGEAPPDHHVYELHLGDDGVVNLVHTPFFGVGQLSYAEVAQIANRVASL